MHISTTGRFEGYSLGLDVSLTDTGVFFASMSPDLDDFYFSVKSNQTYPDVYREFMIAEEIIHEARAIIDYSDLLIVAIEDYGPIGRFSGKLTQRAEAIGILKRFFLRDARVPLVLIDPKSLKKYSTGSGNAKKQDMMRQADAKFSLFENNDNLADAALLAHFGYAVHAGQRVGVRHERIPPE